MVFYTETGQVRYFPIANISPHILVKVKYLVYLEQNQATIWEKSTCSWGELEKQYANSIGNISTRILKV